jgi:hypothetical protein
MSPGMSSFRFIFCFKKILSTNDYLLPAKNWVAYPESLRIQTWKQPGFINTHTRVYRNICTHIRTHSVSRFGPLEAFKSTETRKLLKISTVAYAISYFAHRRFSEGLRHLSRNHCIKPVRRFSTIQTLRFESGRAEQ